MVSAAVKKTVVLFWTGAMAARAHSAPAQHCARPTPHPAPRGAPGAEGDRSRIRWTPAGVPDGHQSSSRTDSCACTARTDNITDTNTDTTPRSRRAVWLCAAAIIAAILTSSACARHRTNQRTTTANFTQNDTATTQQAQKSQQNFMRAIARPLPLHTRQMRAHT